MSDIYCIGDSNISFFSKTNSCVGTMPLLRNVYNEQFHLTHYEPRLAYNLGNENHTNYQTTIKNVELCKGNNLLFSFGLLDIKAHITKQSYLQKRSIRAVTFECVSRYISFIKKIADKAKNIIVYGPIPTVCNEKITPKDFNHYTQKERNLACRYFNEFLKIFCGENNFFFCTLFWELIDKNYTVKEDYYLQDGIHLNCENYDLIKPQIDKFNRLINK